MTNIAVGAVGGVGLITSPKTRSPESWRRRRRLARGRVARGGAGPAGPRRSAPGEAPLRRPLGRHRGSQLRRGKGSGRRSALVGQPRLDGAPRPVPCAPGPGDGGRDGYGGRREGASEAGGYRVARPRPGRIEHLPGLDTTCCRRGASAPRDPACAAVGPRLPARAAGGASAGSRRGRRARSGPRAPSGSLCPRPLPGCGLRAVIVCRGLAEAFLPG